MMTGRLSATERTEIQRLAELGRTPGQIAAKINRNPSTVNFAMTSMGLRSQVARTFAYTRNGSEVRSFSPDEDALIQALRCQQYTTTKIGEVCGKRFGHPRSAATINIRLRALATVET